MKAAKGDGWKAWKHLLNRYDNFTDRDIDTTLKALESLKHQHGTNMAVHLDKFGLLVSRLAQFGRLVPENELIRRLKDSITEDTYKAVKTLINQQNLPGQQPFLLEVPELSWSLARPMRLVYSSVPLRACMHV